jgi:hypothetical protein
MVENEMDSRIKCLRSDNGGDGLFTTIYMNAKYFVMKNIFNE